MYMELKVELLKLRYRLGNFEAILNNASEPNDPLAQSIQYDYKRGHNTNYNTSNYFPMINIIIQGFAIFENPENLL